MSDYVSALQAQNAYDHWMNIAYAFTAACIIYKAIAISVLAHRAPRIIKIAMKGSVACVGTVVAIKALGRFEGGDAAQWLDIMRELSWCALLATIAFYLDQLTKKQT